MKLTSDEVSSEQLGHLGLLAAVIRELGIIEKLDERLDLDKSKGGIVSYGQRTAAMILNGLGFMNSRLYMTPHYFQNKPVAQLLDTEIKAEHLNDDCLGRCLDKIAAYGTTKLFSEVAFEIAQEKGLLSHRLHLDSTSFVLHGRYEDSTTSPIPCRGYSKAHRADLKQVMLSLTQGGEANLPLWMEALDGNSHDKVSFQDTAQKVSAFIAQLKDAPNELCFVVDAAFYVPDKLAELEAVNWITRVPAQLKEAKALLHSPTDHHRWEKIDEDYQLTSCQITVGGLAQRWVMVYSKPAYERSGETLKRQLSKQYDTLNKTLWHLSHQCFGCRDDAHKAIKPILQKFPCYQVNYCINPVVKYPGRGRPRAGATKEKVGYGIDYTIASDLDKIEQSRQMLGRFILATNQLESTQLSDERVLQQYKEQSSVESGFKFIKNNAFELDSFFLKTSARIGALMMIMTLCLMVYNFAQYHLRKCLKENDDVLPNQQGKAIQNPTMKWIAEIMVTIAVVTIQTDSMIQRIVTNINQIQRKIIAYFGKWALKIYGLPSDYQQNDIPYHNYKNFLDWCEM